MLVSNISDTIAESKISALDIASNLSEFSKVVTDNLAEEFQKLGLKLIKLIIENISFPEAVEKAIDTRSSMGVLEGKMDTYVKYQSANAIGEAAKNPGTGGVGATIGTGMALGEVIRDSIKSSTASAKEEEKPGKFCPECGAKNRVNAKFCSECGKPISAKGKCPKCGADVGKAKFCPECGTKQ